MAAIAPTPTGTASCIYLPRLRTVRTASANVERARGHVRRILAQAVPGDKIRLQTFFLQHAPRRHRRRQNRRLRDLGQLQFFFRTFKAKLGQLVAERLVGLLKGSTRNRIVVGQFFAHANGLRALAGKEKSNSRRVNLS